MWQSWINMKRTQRSKDTGVRFTSMYGWQQYCPECRVTNTMAHTKDCKTKIKCYISPKARVPKKNANEKIWKRFENKFCKREMRYIEENKERLMNDYPKGASLD